MKIKDYFYIAKNYFKKGKKASLSSRFFIYLSIFIFLISSTISSTLEHFMDENFNKNFHYRSLSVTNFDNDYTVDELKILFKDLEHVSYIYEQDNFTFRASMDEFENEKIDGGVKISINDFGVTPNLVAGRPLENNNEIVCPKTFIPDGNIFGRIDLTRGDSINLGERLGEELIISFNIHDHSYETPKIIERSHHSFTLVGVFDHELSYLQPNNCFVLADDLDDLVKLSKGNYVKPSYVQSPRIVIVDNAMNVEQVASRIENMGFYVSKYASTNYFLSEVIGFLGNYLSIISLLIAIIMIFISNVSRVEENTNEVGLLKALGYRERDIRLIFVLQTLIMTLTIFIISVLILLILVFGLKMYLLTASIHFAVLKINLSLQDIMIVFLYTVVIPFSVNYLLLIKLLKIDSTVLLRR